MLEKQHIMTTTTLGAPAPNFNISRRSLAGGAAALLGMAGAAPVAAVTSPDADLLAIGREAIPLIAAYERSLVAFFDLPAGHPGLAAAAAMGDAPYERLEVLIEQASNLKAKTPEGCVVKAQLLRHSLMMEHREGMEFVPDHDGAALAWSLVNDLAGRAGV